MQRFPRSTVSMLAALLHGYPARLLAVALCFFGSLLFTMTGRADDSFSTLRDSMETSIFFSTCSGRDAQALLTNDQGIICYPGSQGRDVVLCWHSPGRSQRHDCAGAR